MRHKLIMYSILMSHSGAAINKKQMILVRTVRWKQQARPSTSSLRRGMWFSDHSRHASKIDLIKVTINLLKEVSINMQGFIRQIIA